MIFMVTLFLIKLLHVQRGLRNCKFTHKIKGGGTLEIQPEVQQPQEGLPAILLPPAGQKGTLRLNSLCHSCEHENIPKVQGWFTSGTPAPAQSSKVSGGRMEQFYPTWLRLHLVTTGYSPLWCAPESLTRESVCSAKPLKHVTSL